jgi:hypothetical protein
MNAERPSDGTSILELRIWSEEALWIIEFPPPEGKGQRLHKLHLPLLRFEPRAFPGAEREIENGSDEVKTQEASSRSERLLAELQNRVLYQGSRFGRRREARRGSCPLKPFA